MTEETNIIGMEEHIKIIEYTVSVQLRKEIDFNGEKLTVKQVAEELGVSIESVDKTRREHDQEVAKQGYCSECRRGGGRLYQMRIHPHS